VQIPQANRYRRHSANPSDGGGARAVPGSQRGGSFEAREENRWATRLRAWVLRARDCSRSGGSAEMHTSSPGTAGLGNPESNRADIARGPRTSLWHCGPFVGIPCRQRANSDGGARSAGSSILQLLCIHHTTIMQPLGNYHAIIRQPLGNSCTGSQVIYRNLGPEHGLLLAKALQIREIIYALWISFAAGPSSHNYMA